MNAERGAELYDVLRLESVFQDGAKEGRIDSGKTYLQRDKRARVWGITLWSCMGGRPHLGHCLRDWYRVLPQGIGNEGLCCQKTGGRVYTCGDREGGKVGFVGMGELPWRVSCFGSLGAWDGCVYTVRLCRAGWGRAGAAAVHLCVGV